MFTTNHNVLTKKMCPLKDEFVYLAKTVGNTKKVQRALKELSLVRIQKGYFDYSEVIQTIIERNKNDKA